MRNVRILPIQDLASYECRCIDHLLMITHFMIKRDPFVAQIALVLVLVFLPIIEHEELTVWHPSGVTRTRIRVTGVNFIKNCKNCINVYKKGGNVLHFIFLIHT